MKRALVEQIERALVEQMERALVDTICKKLESDTSFPEFSEFGTKFKKISPPPHPRMVSRPYEIFPFLKLNFFI